MSSNMMVVQKGAACRYIALYWFSKCTTSQYVVILSATTTFSFSLFSLNVIYLLPSCSLQIHLCMQLTATKKMHKECQFITHSRDHVQYSYCCSKKKPGCLIELKWTRRLPRKTDTDPHNVLCILLCNMDKSRLKWWSCAKLR